MRKVHRSCAIDGLSQVEVVACAGPAVLILVHSAFSSIKTATATTPNPGKKGKKSIPYKKSEHELPAVEHLEKLSGRKTRSIKLTIRAPAMQTVNSDEDPGEKRYCYCNQVSYGTVSPCVELPPLKKSPT